MAVMAVMPVMAHTYGPPEPSTCIARPANTSATVMAPPADKSQPMTLIPPNDARTAGRRKIPEPITFPVTREVAVHNPRGLLPSTVKTVPRLTFTTSFEPQPVDSEPFYPE